MDVVAVTFSLDASVRPLGKSYARGAAMLLLGMKETPAAYPCMPLTTDSLLPAFLPSFAPVDVCPEEATGITKSFIAVKGFLNITRSVHACCQ